MPRPRVPPTGFDIPIDKLTKFLLSIEGRKPDRAIFFLGLGFDPRRPEELAQALYAPATPGIHVGFVSNDFGYSVVYEGTLTAPVGDARDMRSVWQMLEDSPTGRARFVTANRYR